MGLWMKRRHEAAEGSFRIAQACQEKGKGVEEVPEVGKRGSTHGDKV